MSGRVINNEKEATSEEPDFKDLKKGIVGDYEFRKSLRNSLGRLRVRLKIKYEELFLSHFIRCKDSLN